MIALPQHPPAGRGQAAPSTLIFTDLDGTLLDDRYDLDGARALAAELAREGKLLIPATSKTLAELQAFTRPDGPRLPLIAENGAVIAWPGAAAAEPWRIERPERSYAELCAWLNDLRARHGFRFQGFADFSDRRLAELTGLTLAGAALARQRLATEPVRWQDTPEQLHRFRAALAAEHLHLVRGGRFGHVMPLTDKGAAASRVLYAMTKRSRCRPFVIACGDSDNDLPLLEMADACIAFPNRQGTYPVPAAPTIVRAETAGIAAWTAALQTLCGRLRDE